MAPSIIQRSVVAAAMLTAFLHALSAQAADGVSQARQDPPNIVIILSDDYGWGSAHATGADPDCYTLRTLIACG